MKSRILTEEEIKSKLKSLAGWSYKDNSLQRDYEFVTFEVAIDFMVECKPLISAKNHHPKWTNVYNRLHVAYNNHDEGNVVTEICFEMAKILEDVYQRAYSG